eukprot:365734-Chlamydomonas_euryale.AAC.31
MHMCRSAGAMRLSTSRSSPLAAVRAAPARSEGSGAYLRAVPVCARQRAFIACPAQRKSDGAGGTDSQPMTTAVRAGRPLPSQNGLPSEHDNSVPSEEVLEIWQRADAGAHMLWNLLACCGVRRPELGTENAEIRVQHLLGNARLPLHMHTQAPSQ